MVLKEGEQQRQPRALDRKLEEHHHRQLEHQHRRRLGRLAGRGDGLVIDDGGVGHKRFRLKEMMGRSAIVPATAQPRHDIRRLTTKKNPGTRPWVWWWTAMARG